MLCLAVMLIFVVQYLVLYLRGEHLWQNRISENIHQVSKLYSSNNTSIADNVGPVCPYLLFCDDTEHGHRRTTQILTWRMTRTVA